MSEKYTTQQLVSLLKANNQPAFLYLYENYAGALYTLILSIVIEETTAEDIMQDVFVKVFKHIEQYDESKGRLYTWITQIARNTSIDFLRSSNTRKTQQHISLSNTDDMADPAAENFRPLGLRTLVVQLKEDYKTIVLLHYFMGYTHVEISQILSIPLGTVKTRLRASLRELRKII